MYKKIISTSLFFIILLGSGFGCKGLSSTEQASITPVTLNYWTVYGNTTELQRMAAEYSALHSYITINIRQLQYEEYQDKLVNALADDVGPDIVSMHVRDLRKHLTRLSPEPATTKVFNVKVEQGFNKQTIITPEINALPTLTSIKNNYIQTVAEDVGIANKIYGLPLAIDTMALYYNKDLLDQAGVATPPSNWTEFVEAIKQSTKLDPNDPNIILQSGAALGTSKNIDNASDIYALLLMQKGITIIDGQAVTFAENDNQAQLNPAVDSLRFYTDFARSDKDTYTWNDQMGNAFEQFVRGRSVFYIGFSFDYNRIKARAPQMNLALTPMIQLSPEAPVNIASYWVESVTKKSKHQNEAWDFIRFLSLPDNIKKYSAVAFTPSALRVHNKDQKNEENPLSPFALQVLQSKNWYRGKNSSEAKNAFGNLISEYLKPYKDERDEQERDPKLLFTAVQTLQQTL
jgi:multiple sugar transport system substrate-binding protein